LVGSSKGGEVLEGERGSGGGTAAFCNRVRMREGGGGMGISGGGRGLSGGVVLENGRHGGEISVVEGIGRRKDGGTWGDAGIGVGRGVRGEGCVVDDAGGPVVETVKRVGVDVRGGRPGVKEVGVGSRKGGMGLEIGEDTTDLGDRKDGFGFRFSDRGFEVFWGKSAAITGIGSFDVGENGVKLKTVRVRGRLRNEGVVEAKVVERMGFGLKE
jgi:hypothetical protein